MLISSRTFQLLTLLATLIAMGAMFGGDLERDILVPAISGGGILLAIVAGLAAVHMNRHGLLQGLCILVALGGAVVFVLTFGTGTAMMLVPLAGLALLAAFVFAGASRIAARERRLG